MLAETHRAAQAKLGDVTAQLLGVLWTRTVDPSQLDRTFPAYASAAVPIVLQGRAASTRMARQYYETEAAAHGRKALAIPSVPGNPEQIYKSLEATGPVRVKHAMAKGKSLDAANYAGIKGVEGSAKRHTLDGGREFIASAVKKDPVLHAYRISRGARTCSFCKALISRGPVYTVDSVKFRSHDGCDCGWRIAYPEDGDGWSDEAKQLRELWKRYPDLREFEAANRILSGETHYSLLLGDDVSAALRAERMATLAARNKYIRDFRDAIADLPDDLTHFGAVDNSAEWDEWLQAKADEEAYNKFGMSWDELQKRYNMLHDQEKALSDLYEWFHTHPDWDIDPKKWLKDKPRDVLKVLGWDRKQPGTVYGAMWEMRSRIKKELFDFDIDFAGVKQIVESYEHNKDIFFFGKLFKPDLTAAGHLGAGTKKALDSVLRGGKILDDEIQRRMAKKMATLPDSAAWVEFHKLKTRMYDDMFFKRDTPMYVFERYDELWPTARRYGEAYSRLQQQTAREVLSEIREMGGGKRSVYKMLDSADGRQGELQMVMDHAHGLYPSDWNDRLFARNPTVELGLEGRGFNTGGDKIVLSGDEHAVGNGGRFGHTAVHELGHSMENAVPGLKGLEWAYHYERSQKQFDRLTQSWKLADEIDIYGNGKEWAVPDAWQNRYVGKDYTTLTQKIGPEENWEVFTTGIESLYEGSPYFGATGEDAEFRQFILGVLGAL